jgi:putative ABC transport system permease protein
MFFIHLKIAWRNLVRNKVYSAINIGGLSIGIAISLLISLYVIHEYSYDSFHKNADRIYGMYLRVKLTGAGDSVNYPLTSYRSGPALMQADPSVESFVRVKANFGNDPIIQSVASPERKFTDNFLFADSNFFSFYSFPLKEGNADQVLSRPFAVVISERMAKKYFGNADPVGHLLKYDSAYIFEITGVAENAPSNSTLQYDFVASLSSSLSMKDGKHISEASNLTMGIFSTNLLLRKGANPRNSETLFKKLVDQNKNYNDTTSRCGLLPLTATHLFYDGFDTSNIKYLKIFMLAGVLILLLALINYMSMATANSTQRAKEIGVRKVIGANRSTIARQFYVESALYVTIAFILGFALFNLVQASFFHRIQLAIDTSFLYKSRVMLAFGALFVISILVAGSYPSIVLSSFNPISVLYGKLSRERGGVNVRRFFIVLQFSISVGMIISSLVIERQMYFFRHTDTGINRENVVMMNFGNGIGKHYRSFKNDVSQLAGVSEVATAQYALYRGYAAYAITTREVKTPPTARGAHGRRSFYVHPAHELADTAKWSSHFRQ